MVKGLYTAYTGMINQQNRLDVLTNNLANSATNGFKKEGSTSQSFDEMLAIKIKDTSDMGLPKGLGDVSLGVKIGECYTDFGQGNFRVTDNIYDLAINGDGFFAISFTNKAGEASVKYTRDGAFTVNREGYLMTKDGDYVLNQAAAQAGNPGQAGYIRVDPNLELQVDENGNLYQNGALLGQRFVSYAREMVIISTISEITFTLDISRVPWMTCASDACTCPPSAKSYRFSPYFSKKL